MPGCRLPWHYGRGDQPGGLLGFELRQESRDNPEQAKRRGGFRLLVLRAGVVFCAARRTRNGSNHWRLDRAQAETGDLL